MPKKPASATKDPTKTAIALLIALGEGDAVPPANLRSAFAVLGGKVDGFFVPVEGTVEALADRKEAERFVAGLTKAPGVPPALILDLVRATADGIDRGHDAGARAPILGLVAASKKRDAEWLDVVLDAHAAAKQAKEPAIAAAIAKLAPKERDALDAGLVNEPHGVIEVILAAAKKKQTLGPAKLSRLVRVIRGDYPLDAPFGIDAVFQALKTTARAKAFVSALRALAFPKDLLLDLACEAVRQVPEKKRRAVAFPVSELLVDAEPSPAATRSTAKRHEMWLWAVNNVLYWSLKAKETKLAALFGGLALPHVGANDNLPHNAAAGLVCAKRYDDAVAVCRVAAKNKYKDLKKMPKDRELQPLWKREDFQAIFAKR